MFLRKTVLITGCTRGLGRALLLGVADEGHTVIGCGRDPELVTALGDELGSPHRINVVDVSRDDAVKKWADSVLSVQGAPDLVVNNAALMNRSAPLWAMSADEFDRVVAVNLNGVTNVIRHFAPAMIERGTGVFANISSGWGRSTSPNVAPYCGTKWGVEGLSLALAQDLPTGLASVPVNPGVIDTDMLRQCFGESAAQYERPEEWARRAVPFFLSLGPDDNGRSVTV